MRHTVLLLAVVAMGWAGEAPERSTRAHQAFLAARYSEAEAGYRAALAAGSERSLSRAVAMENLGVTLRAQGRLDEALPLLEKAAREIETMAGTDSAEALQALGNLASLYWSKGELDKAESAALRAGDRKTLASVYLSQRRFGEAAGLLRVLVEETDSASAVTLYANLTAAAIGMGRNDEAEEYARRGDAVARRVLPEVHPMRAVVLNNLAQACRFNAKFAEAESHYLEAISIWGMTLGPDHPDLGRGLMNLAAFYHDRGREAGAEQLYLRAIAILEKADAILVLVARNELADVLRAQLRYTEATKLARSTLAQMASLLRPDDARLQRAMLNWDRLSVETRRSTVPAKASR